VDSGGSTISWMAYVTHDLVRPPFPYEADFLLDASPILCQELERRPVPKSHPLACLMSIMWSTAHHAGGRPAIFRSLVALETTPDSDLEVNNAQSATAKYTSTYG
jgi:hypothetical protein